MVQSVNLAGVAGFFAALLNPALLHPHVVVADVTRINWARLRQDGYRVVVFDKDNCLTAPYALEVHPPFKPVVDQVKQLFGAQNVCVLSNSAGTRDFAYTSEIQDKLDLRVITHSEKKPAGSDFLRSLFPDTNRGQFVVVGDRLLTDVVFGRRLGGLAVLTRNIISAQNDNAAARYIRGWEHSYVDRYVKTGDEFKKYIL